MKNELTFNGENVFLPVTSFTAAPKSGCSPLIATLTNTSAPQAAGVVIDKYTQASAQGPTHITVTPTEVSKLIKSVGRNCSPGADGIRGEHLIYGRSEVLYNAMQFPKMYRFAILHKK